jgi:hypothetical protein
MASHWPTASSQLGNAAHDAKQSLLIYQCSHEVQTPFATVMADLNSQ